MSTVAIVGSRWWDDWDGFNVLIDGHLPFAAQQALYHADRIVSGGATGVDAMAERWGREHGKEVVIHRTNKAQHGTFVAAAHARNQLIVDELDRDSEDFLIAMPGPDSKGTYDTMRRAEAAGVKVVVMEVPR